MKNLPDTLNCASPPNFTYKAVALGVALALASPAYSNPSGLSVAHGQATVNHVGNLTQITNTPGAILNWQQFNIDVGQTTQFIQESANSQVFNRVTGGEVSKILGKLQSNGQVFLINPAGVFFGAGAVIDTAGFLASSLAASNTDLMNGHLRFNAGQGEAGAIVNQGQLTAHSGGSIVLLAPSVENSGIIHADGQVLLAAGHSVTVVDMKHPAIGLTVSAKAGEEAINLGQVIGRNVSLFGSLVRQEGVVEATKVQAGPGGVVRFVAEQGVKVAAGSRTSANGDQGGRIEVAAGAGDAVVAGQLQANGEDGQGGKVTVTGQRVAVLHGASVQADGANGGGVVHVGGGWKGQDKTMRNARHTVIQQGAQVSANALTRGDGGEVVAWSDGHTAVASSLQAKGGQAGGNGGRVETSGKQSLDVQVSANTSAPQGKAGQWVIDPANLTVVDQIPPGGVNLGDSQFEGSGFFSDFSSNPESFLLNSTVVSGLENNGFVGLYTTGSSPGEGNLTISAPVLLSNNFTGSSNTLARLYIEAQGSVSINAPVGLNPGFTPFSGLDLELNYDIAKPVNINAPLYLGETGLLVLAPYDVGNALPVNVAGQLPLDGVNFLSGMNSANPSGSLSLPRIELVDTLLTDPNTMQPLSVGAGRSARINILGARLTAEGINNFSSQMPLDVKVGLDPSAAGGPVAGSLTYEFLNANSLEIADGASVTARRLRFGSGSTSLNSLTVNGSLILEGGNAFIESLTLNGGSIQLTAFEDSMFSNSGGVFADIANLNTAAGTVFEVRGSSLNYGVANIDGTVRALNGTDSFSSSFISGFDTNLNGTMELAEGFNLASLQNLGMGSSARIQLGARSELRLGGSSAFHSEGGTVAPKVPGAYISSTNGQFTAAQGAVIELNGAPDFAPLSPSVLELVETPSTTFGFGATLDVTGLDGRLDAPVNIEVTGLFNSLVTEDTNVDFSQENATFFPINTLSIASANITVNAGQDQAALRIGQVQSVESPGQRPPEPTIDTDFRGTLTVNSGRVLIEGANVSTSAGNLSVNGSGSSVRLDGRFTSSDLNAVNRTGGGRLAASGIWDNSAVTLANSGTASPLAKGTIFVNDDLTVFGGVLNDAGNSAGGFQVSGEGLLELQNTELSTRVQLAPNGVLLLASQDQSGNPVAPVVLNNATVNFGGDALLVVESDASGNAALNGTANLNSSSQGNLILAGRRVFDNAQLSLVPDHANLTIGNGIRLNVNGNAASLPEGLAFYYDAINSAADTNRPVFRVGQLTPEAVGLIEYDNFDGFSTPSTTVLSGFAGESFVADGMPDPVFPNLNCTVPDFCVKFDVSQNVVFQGQINSVLNASSPALGDSGVVFPVGTDLSAVSFLAETANEIRYVSGLHQIDVNSLSGGKRLVNGGGSTLVFGANTMNQVLNNDIENNGTLNVQGAYIFNGLMTGNGALNNSGGLVLGNANGSVLSNSIVNTGSLTVQGNYTLAGVLTGTGSLQNNGTLSVQGSGNFTNSVANSSNGNLSFSGSNGQSLQFTNSFTNIGNVNFNGGTFGFANGFNQTAGNTTLQPGTRLNGNININGGSLRGFATLAGNLNGGGARLLPGASPGLITIDGDFNLDANSVVDIEILSNGGVKGVDFDCIEVSGNANLAGQLNLIDISGGTLGAGNQYDFITASAINGTFASVSKSGTPASYAFSDPQVFAASAGQGQLLRTSTVAVAAPPTPPSTPTAPVPTDSTGANTSPVGQNLNQAFVPSATQTSSGPPSPSQPSPGPGSQQSTTTTEQPEREQVVEAASQSTGGAPVSQRSNNIQMSQIKSDPKRVGAVCK